MDDNRVIIGVLISPEKGTAEETAVSNIKSLHRALNCKPQVPGWRALINARRNGNEETESSPNLQSIVRLCLCDTPYTKSKSMEIQGLMKW